MLVVLATEPHAGSRIAVFVYTVKFKIEPFKMGQFLFTRPGQNHCLQRPRIPLFCNDKHKLRPLLLREGFWVEIILAGNVRAHKLAKAVTVLAIWIRVDATKAQEATDIGVEVMDRARASKLANLAVFGRVPILQRKHPIVQLFACDVAEGEGSRRQPFVASDCVRV